MRLTYQVRICQTSREDLPFFSMMLMILILTDVLFIWTIYDRTNNVRMI
ncbi:MAG: hypothetical protein N2V72_05225 [Methanophagales archaeon]|nr:hypothetical protein [Methanophagales archaeon]MCW3141562.1 hypothetical protein [Methanophagales archaeon]